MDRKLTAMVDMARRGALCYVYDPSVRGSTRFLLGGVVPVKFNWIMYFPAFLGEAHDLHDALFTRFKEFPDTITFKDQFGSDIHFSELESYDKELIRQHKQWQKELESSEFHKEALESAVADRLKDPMYYLHEAGSEMVDEG